MARMNVRCDILLLGVKTAFFFVKTAQYFCKGHRDWSENFTICFVAERITIASFQHGFIGRLGTLGYTLSKWQRLNCSRNTMFLGMTKADQL